MNTTKLRPYGVTESGWHVPTDSRIGHYVLTAPGRHRATWSAICGEVRADWELEPDRAWHYCEDCAADSRAD